MIGAIVVEYSQLSDDALLRLIARSRHEALSELYDRYSRLVFSLALNSVGDYSLAEEITQDVFVRVWEKAYTYRVEQAKVTTWLTSITRYRAIDIIRRRQVRPEQNSIQWEDLTPNQMPAASSDPESQAELALEKHRLLTAISALPNEQRQALALAFFQGLSHREIAEQLGEPLGTVKTRIRLAMQKLREALEKNVTVYSDREI